MRLEYFVEIQGSWLKVIPDSFATKEKVVNYLKELQFQFYVVPNLETPLKVFHMVLYNSTNSNSIQAELIKIGFDVIKVVQMPSCKDGRILPLVLMHSPRTVNSKNIFQMKQLFKIRIEIDIYKAPKSGAVLELSKNLSRFGQLSYLITVLQLRKIT